MKQNILINIYTDGIYVEDGLYLTDFVPVGYAPISGLNVLDNKIEYVNGTKIIGGIETISESAGSFSAVDGTTVKVLAPEGYCNGTTSLITVSDANLIAANIKSGVTIFGVLGTYTGA